MAKSTFSGPIQSLAGFISAGNANVVSLTATTSLSVNSHSGKVLACNDADGQFVLPSIIATAPGEDTDPHQTNNLGATFTFVVETAATDMDILTVALTNLLVVYTQVKMMPLVKHLFLVHRMMSSL